MAVQIPKGHHLYQRCVELAEQAGIDLDTAPRAKVAGEIGGKPSRRLLEGSAGEWVVVIPNWRPSSLNAIVNQHWGKAYRIKQDDKETLYIECWKAGVRAAKGKRWIGLEVGLSGRQKKYDRDNAWKSFLDALTSIGAIVDDSEDWLDYGKPVWTQGQGTCTKITIRDIER